MKGVKGCNEFVDRNFIYVHSGKNTIFTGQTVQKSYFNYFKKNFMEFFFQNI